MNLLSQIHSSSGAPLISTIENRQIIIDENVHRLLNKDFQIELDNYLIALSKFWKEDSFNQINTDNINNLPFGVESDYWKARRNDLKFIEKHLTPKAEILEIGSNMGWLANYLSQKEHAVTAIDYFLDPRFGLKAFNKYADPKWTAINMDIDDIDRFNPIFDLVIFNHGINFYSNPFDLLEKAKNILKPKGSIVLLGLHFFRQKEGALDYFKKSEAEFKSQFGMNLSIKPPSNLVLLEKDMEEFKNEDITLLPEKAGSIPAITAKIKGKKYRSFRGIYKN